MFKTFKTENEKKTIIYLFLDYSCLYRSIKVPLIHIINFLLTYKTKQFDYSECYLGFTKQYNIKILLNYL